MKRKTLGILSIILSSIMIFGTVLPTSAYNLDENNNSVESVEYQNTADEDFSNVTNVFAQIGSEYKVTIPKVVVLSGASKDARYFVKVAGDIAGYEKVSVIPENSFKLFAKNKDSQTATVNQDKTVWTVHDFDTDANGLIQAKNITAGKWQGKFNFNINLESDDVSVLPEEKVLGDLVVPDANEWNGQTLQNIYVMEVGDTGILKATNDGEDVSDLLEITSSNENVVKTENKQLEAVGVGQTTITTVYEDKFFSAKIKVVEPETPAHTHTAGKAIKENEIAATYEKEGSYEEVVYCTDCGEELSRTTKVIPKLLAAGLYDENDNLIKSWDELVKLGLNIGKDYNDYSAYRTEATSGYSVFKNNNLSGKLIISDTVTSIGKDAFYGCTSLTSVAIPGSVTSIGESAFGCCTSLESITIPNSMTSIGNYAFMSCTSLTSIVIPNSVTSISSNAFQDCTSLESVIIPDSVTSIGDYAFRNCTSLTQITIPNSVTSIGNNAFNGCTSLESVIIPESVTSIGEGAFSGCTSLESITLGKSVTSISKYAFWNCKKLTSITIPDSVTSIGDYAFQKCTSLESITIPDSITSIGYYVFKDCTSLKLVTLGKSVTSIGDRTFNNCTSLESITLPDSITSIGYYVFENCTSLTSITYRGVTYTDKTTFNNKLKSDGVAPANTWT